MTKNIKAIKFDEGVTQIGLTVDDLIIEAFNTGGTSNYLANLNYRGQTWAAALRLPAAGSDLNTFIEDKAKSLKAIDYLVSMLSEGIDTGFNCKLRFDGVSCFVDNKTTKEYMHQQSSKKPLELIDNIQGTKSIATSFNYPTDLSEDVRSYIEEYTGPIYLSRGAPANETLEDYPELLEAVAHALAKLHLLTGKGTPVPLNKAIEALSYLDKEIDKEIPNWKPQESSKELRALIKSLAKWWVKDDRLSQLSETQKNELLNKPDFLDNYKELLTDDDIRIIHLIKKERFIRTSIGRDMINKLLNIFLDENSIKTMLKSFCHGDAHGGNFILVRFQYRLNKPNLILDREYLNNIFVNNPDIEDIAIVIDKDNGVILHDKIENTDNPTAIATRGLHHEIHLIDLDDVMGIDDETKTCHLLDALTYTLSMVNITSLVSKPVTPETILSYYYNGLSVL